MNTGRPPKTAKCRSEEFFDRVAIIKIKEAEPYDITPETFVLLEQFWDEWLKPNPYAKPSDALYVTLYRFLRQGYSDLFEKWKISKTLTVHSFEHTKLLFGVEETIKRLNKRNQNIRSIVKIKDVDKVKQFLNRKCVHEYLTKTNFEITDDHKRELGRLLCSIEWSETSDRELLICDLMINNHTSDYISRFKTATTTKWQSVEHVKARFGENYELVMATRTHKNTELARQVFRSTLTYWIKQGYSSQEAEEQRQQYQKWAFEHRTDLTSPRSYKFWKNKGFDDEQIRHKLKSIQSRGETFFYSKYGQNASIKIAEMMQRRRATWLRRPTEMRLRINKTKGRTYNQLCDVYGIESARKIARKRLSNFTGVSKISKLFFKELDSILPVHISKKSVTAYKTNEWFINTDSSFYTVDYKVNNKIIEFYGSFWHCDPRMYNDEYIHPITKITASQIHENDNTRVTEIKSKGFDVLEIWSLDVKNDKSAVLNKCINFILSNAND